MHSVHVAALPAKTQVPQPAPDHAGTLTVLADRPRQPHDGGHAGLPAGHVGLKRGVERLLLAAHRVELLGQHGCVLHGHACALAHVGAEGVDGVTEKDDAAGHPAVQTDLLDVRAQDAGRGLELGERRPDARIGEFGEARAEGGHAIEGPVMALRRRVEGRPDVQLLLADGHEADALAASVELREVLEPIAILHDEAVRAIPQVDGRHDPEEPIAHLGVNAVGAHEHITVEDRAILHLHPCAFRRDQEFPDARAEPDGIGRKAAEEHVVEVGPVHEGAHGDAPGLVEGAIVARGEPSSRLIQRVAPEVRPAALPKLVGQTISLEHAHGVRVHDDSRTDRAELRRPLQHHAVEAAQGQLAREREPADPAAHDQRPHPRRHGTPMLDHSLADTTVAS